MSPILDIQRTHRRLGKVRMGTQKPDRNGKNRPAKLEEWRLTSPSPDLIAAAADVYGGQVEEWADAPDGKQFQVFTDTTTLKVLIPPTYHGDTDALVDDSVFSQGYELWSAGGCQRRCTGTGGTNVITGEACSCPVDPEVRDEKAKAGKACKITTRLSVLLPDIPDIGTWMLESHGYYAAVELGGGIELLRSAAPGRMVPAQLRIDQRTAKRMVDGKPETRRYAVPVLELVTVTTGALMAGGGEAVLAPGRPVQIGGGGGGRPALAPPAPQAAPGLPPLPGEIGPTSSASTRSVPDEGGEVQGAGLPVSSSSEGGSGPAPAPPTGPGTPGTLADVEAAMSSVGMGKAAARKMANALALQAGLEKFAKWDDVGGAPPALLERLAAWIRGGGGSDDDPAEAPIPAAQTSGGGGGTHPEVAAAAPAGDPQEGDQDGTLPLSATDAPEFKRVNRRMQARATEAAAASGHPRDQIRKTLAWCESMGRTTSWSDLTLPELHQVDNRMESIISGRLTLTVDPDPKWDGCGGIGLAWVDGAGEAAA